MKKTKKVLMPRMPLEILFQIKKRHGIVKNRKKDYETKIWKNNRKKQIQEEME